MKSCCLVRRKQAVALKTPHSKVIKVLNPQLRFTPAALNKISRNADRWNLVRPRALDPSYPAHPVHPCELFGGPGVWRGARFRANVAPMREKVYPDFDAAVADIPDGASIMLAGFAGPGTARNLIAALFRQGAKGLTLISNTPGRWQDDRIDSGVLVKEGRVARIHAAFTASPHPSVPSPFTDLYEAGKIEAELMPQGTLAERIRAAGCGHRRVLHAHRRRHGDGGGQGDARLRRQGVRDGDRAPRRLRLRPRAPRRPLRQPAVPPHAAQLRPRHGARREDDHRRGRRAGRRGGRHRTPTTSTRPACSWTASSSSRRTAYRRSRPSDERTPHSRTLGFTLTLALSHQGCGDQTPHNRVPMPRARARNQAPCMAAVAGITAQARECT